MAKKPSCSSGDLRRQYRHGMPFMNISWLNFHTFPTFVFFSQFCLFNKLLIRECQSKISSKDLHETLLPTATLSQLCPSDARALPPPPSLRSFTRFNGGSTERGGEESRGMTTELWTFAFAPMWTVRQIWKRERGREEGRKAKADVETV